MLRHIYNLVFIDDDTTPEVPDTDAEYVDSALRPLNSRRSSTDTMADDRASIYLDTVSMTSDFAAADMRQQPTSQTNRKSLSQSRQTIYHSAEDVMTASGGDFGSISKSGRRKSTAAATVAFLTEMREPQRNGNTASNGGNGLPAGASLDPNDEVLIDTSSSNRAVSYSEWKSRTWRHFQDNKRTVDYVLAYRPNDPHTQHPKRRRIFEDNLIAEGLELEHETTQHIHFVKIHAPFEVLCRYCEILKMRMPIKRVHEQNQLMQGELQLLERIKRFCGRPFDFVDLDRSLFPDQEYRLHHEYSRNNTYLYEEEKPGFFTPIVVHAVVHFILERKRFSDADDTTNDVGIDKLLSEGIYEAAYPLHDGDCRIASSQRHLLTTEWAALSKWIKHQPLDQIKEYFGVKIALYFAWLGFYTHMLIPASVVGIVCFLFGLATINSNRISEDICDSGKTFLMCPQCDRKCDYWYLSETCIYSRISNLFDNQFTVAFACFMSFWAVLYLELWKRYSAKLIHRWGCSDYTTQAEHPRPEYLARLKTAQKKRFNVIHRVLEPHVPFWKAKFPAYLLSYSVVFLFICLAIAAVFGIVIYRMSLIYSRTLHVGSEHSQTYNMIVLPATAAILNLVIITVLNYAYDYLAIILTNLEYRRTQTEFDDSLTLKISLFQFVNYYSSIFYVAFLKGKFVGRPSKYNRLFGFRQEECSPGGCLMELCIQLVIIMCGKQAMNAVLEMFVPYVMRRVQSMRRTWNDKESARTASSSESLVTCNQWTNDFKLLAWSSRGLYDEYLEMILQFGFITIFVVAFPLAPLFALINNIFEMRLDAQKFLKYYRRPVPSRVKDIGVWFNIMAILSRISTASSAFIIAFSSNFIPRLVYIISVNEGDHSDAGYLNFTLSYFNTTNFEPGMGPEQTRFSNATMCRYAEYRNPPDDPRPYKRGMTYWHILAARLAFLVVFENCMGLVQMIVAWAIPDVPRKLSDRIKREDYLKREIIIEQENKLAQTASSGHAVEHELLKNTLYAGAEREMTQLGVNGDRKQSSTDEDINVSEV